jgi:hypothetical protein
MVFVTLIQGAPLGYSLYNMRHLPSFIKRLKEVCNLNVKSGPEVLKMD